MMIDDKNEIEPWSAPEQNILIYDNDSSICSFLNEPTPRPMEQVTPQRDSAASNSSRGENKSTPKKLSQIKNAYGGPLRGSSNERNIDLPIK